MPTFAALNHHTKQVTGLAVSASKHQAVIDFGPIPPREIMELPDDPRGWSLKRATAHFFPVYE